MLLHPILQDSQEIETIQSQPVDYVCPICECSYLNEKQFYGHLHIHSGDVRWKCTQCTSGTVEFDSQSKLKAHENLHHNNARPHKCEQCDLTFDRASQLDYHHRSIHLGERSQLCEICGKGFFRKTDLKTHLNTHLGTNFCICEICGRKFNHISNLIRHCRMHKGVKPYPCLICGKRFTQINSLARHKRIHERQSETGNKELQNNRDNNNALIKDCTSSKDQSVDVNIKKQKNVVKRQHYCKTCGESFKFIFLLRQHEKSHAENINIQENISHKISPKILDMKQQEESNGGKEFHLSEDIKKGLPLEAMICITSEQMEDPKNKLFREHLIDMEEKIDAMRALTDKTMELNISEMLIPNNTGHISSDNNFKNSENNANVGANYYFYKFNEIVDENKSASLITSQATQLELQKPNDVRNCISDSISENIGRTLQTPDFPPNSNAENSENQNDENDIINREEPMLRLVQTETGEQFYELIISNLVDKIPNTQYAKFTEYNANETSITNENINNISTNTKEMNEQIREQDLQDMADIHNDLHYSQYCLSEAKNFINLHRDETDNLFYDNQKSKECLITVSSKDFQNQGLLTNDLQSDLDRYVEANLEVFEKLTFENNSDKLLELVGISENRTDTSVQKESPMVCFVQNEGEQFFELLQDSQIVDKDQGHEFKFNQMDSTKNDESISNNVPTFSAQTKSDEMFKKDDRWTQNKEEVKKENIEDETKESKKSNILVIKFQCTVCDKTFSTSYNYKQHIGTHFVDQQKFHCKECGISFAWKSTLNKHIANNHRPDGPQKFVCEICPKNYSTLSQVNEHVKRDHLKQRNHTCTQCGKSFFKKYDLKIHNRIHTDERPYVCRACGKRFHHRSHIIRHERIHL